MLPAPKAFFSSALPAVPVTLTATGIGYEVGARVILRDVSVVIGPTTRLGVVGPNGVGKSTLLRVLAGLARPSSGSLSLAPPGATVGYLAQEPARRTDETVRQHLARVSGVESADNELHSAADALARDDAGAERRYGDALEHWQDLGAADFEPRCETVVRDLGIGASVLELPTAALSGGQATSVALAAILISRYQVTLLDEPTNNLDFEGLSRLEGFVAARAGGIVVVSHDRAFLDSSITSVLELDEHDHVGRLFNGGWSAYLEGKSVARRHAEEAYLGYEATRHELLERAQREKQWATRGVTREKRQPRDNDKAQRDFRINRTEQLAARARRTEKALARMDRVEKPWESWDLHFSISAAPRAGAVVARLDQVVVERGSFQLGPIDFEIAWGERVAIAGPNGSGKTTLLQTMLGRLPLTSGGQWLGPSVVVGELGQARDSLAGSGTVLEAVLGATDLRTAEGRSLLAKFGIGADHVNRAPTSLSPGERTRAELAIFQVRGVNLLVLDEPTNHLDMPALEQLEEALAGYNGTLVLVSHDRRFIEAVELTRTVQVLGQTRR
jgi:ATPase subunit of ABC transporter with duplicated ATPase domains